MSDNPLWKMITSAIEKRADGQPTGNAPINAEAAAEWQRQWQERHAGNWVLVGEPGPYQKMIPR